MESEDVHIRIGHSPDPDDAFMFHALTTGAMETPGRHYEHVLLDIQTLNEKALNSEYEISAVSIHSFPKIIENYALMNCGASMGEGYGPMLIGNEQLTSQEAKSRTIAVPGLDTSAYLALRLAWGEVDVEVVPFDEILPAVAEGKYDVGLIIHEGQLTWKDEGVYLIQDLGVWWNEKTGLPLPLGGNVVRRDLGEDLCNSLASDVKKSIEHSLNDPATALEFAKLWGRGIDDETNKQFVQMYVNSRTLDYGPEGRAAVRLFLKEGQKIGLVDGGLDTDSIEFIGVNEND
ncbi:MAG: MqnA/MqnD/SBP family protein [Candidatus Thermoplasmatota archaeon]|nr:MqnA/MqnD/SBP family protein [Candidatus Thermoplasmatota archaeon]MEC9120215.1 MqnA/MqnD/SBP family protein [Candidatus Thermoplasmatota archaeon]